jgi:hypothetical protein
MARDSLSGRLNWGAMEGQPQRAEESSDDNSTSCIPVVALSRKATEMDRKLDAQ